MYVGIHLHIFRHEWLQVVVKYGWSCFWSCQLCELQDTHVGYDQVNISCTWRVGLNVLMDSVHQHNIESFRSHNRTSQQLYAAILICPDAARCCQIGLTQYDVYSGALRQVRWCSTMHQKLWNRMQEYSETCIVAFKMLPNQLLRCANFRAIANVGHVQKTILLHLTPGATHSGSDDYNVYIKLYN